MKPSEALKGLKHIKKYYVPQPCSAKTYDYLEIIEQTLLKTQEQEKVLEILKKGYFSTSYNPEGDYHHITFDIYGEKDYKVIDEWLKEVKKVIVHD